MASDGTTDLCILQHTQCAGVLDLFKKSCVEGSIPWIKTPMGQIHAFAVSQLGPKVLFGCDDETGKSYSGDRRSYQCESQ